MAWPKYKVEDLKGGLVYVKNNRIECRCSWKQILVWVESWVDWFLAE